MTRRDDGVAALSRRAVLTGPAALLAPRPVHGAAQHPFDAWMVERQLLEAALDAAPEVTHGAERQAIFDRLFKVERLVLETDCLDLEAVRAKADLILWTMEMEQADALSAMRHVHCFLHREP